MGSLFETLLFILPWLLLGTSLIFYGHKSSQYTEVCDQLKDAQNIIFITGEKLGEQSLELEKIKQEAKKWENLAIAPKFEPIKDPLIINQEMKLLRAKTFIPAYELDSGGEQVYKSDRSWQKAYDAAQNDFLQEISDYVYRELYDQGYRAEYIQEIYVATPKKLSYEK